MITHKAENIHFIKDESITHTQLNSYISKHRVFVDPTRAKQEDIITKYHKCMYFPFLVRCVEELLYQIKLRITQR